MMTLGWPWHFYVKVKFAFPAFIWEELIEQVEDLCAKVNELIEQVEDLGAKVNKYT